MEKDLNIEIPFLLKSCGLGIWDFDHLIASQKVFQPYHLNISESPYIGLNGGYDEYCNILISRGSTLVKKIDRQRRVLERDVGKIEIQFDITDIRYLEDLLRWRIDRYRKMNYSDAFTFPWSKKLITKLLSIKNHNFSGILSGLFVKNKPVALHMGMRSATVWHYWFPAFDNTYAKYSPGQILLLEMAKNALSMGIIKIDMGKGDEDYKMRFMTDSTKNAVGSVMIPGIPYVLRKILFLLEHTARYPLFYQIARLPGRYVKRIIRNKRFK